MMIRIRLDLIMSQIGVFFKADTTDGTERKVKLKVRRKFKYDFIVNFSLVHLELCFRKKRWYGFTNYHGEAEYPFIKQGCSSNRVG